MQSRRGFTLIEVIVALLLLSVAIIGASAMGSLMFRRVSLANVQFTAVQLAEDRLDFVRLEPVYANLPNYVLNEPVIVGYPGFTRTTTVVRTLNVTVQGTTDFRRVTVQVTSPGGVLPVVRSITIGAP
jgi:prepilin-type N-terminal cleavage/methylation domain-containing protein